MTVSLDALVLPAFDELEDLPSETALWNEHYALDGTVDVRGVPEPVRHDGRIGVVPTGVGKAAAATTVSALLSSSALGLSRPLVLSVGVAGAPPALPIGSVVVADTVVDWDDKCRLDGEELTLNPYTGDRGIFELNRDLTERARAAGAEADLREPEPGTAGDTAHETPAIHGGVNVCGDELWHGPEMAAQVEWLLAERDVAPYRVTEMEDAGTAFALARFGLLDRYLTVRAVSNHDRPRADQDPRESLFDPAFEAGFGVAVENAVRVARAILEEQLPDHPES